jgi:phosphonate transport system substrate-binding protein
MVRPPLVVLTWLAAALAACGEPRIREAELLIPTPEQAEAPEGASHPGDAAPGPSSPRALRVSVAAIESPRDTYPLYSTIFERLGRRLGVEIEFVQRRTYREVNDLIAAGKLDAALLCTGGYLDLERRAPQSVEVLAAPLVAGRPTYESLVIVPADGPALKVADLAGKRFAYTDELSFSGRLYALRLIRDLGEDPERFFGNTIFTQSHDRSIAAVATGLVDGAAVHGGVFDHLLRRDPSLARHVRVIHRSSPFGAMPLVASMRLPAGLRGRFREALEHLAEDPEAAAAMAGLDIDAFARPAPGLYESAARAIEARR